MPTVKSHVSTPKQSFFNANEYLNDIIQAEEYIIQAEKQIFLGLNYINLGLKHVTPVRGGRSPKDGAKILNNYGSAKFSGRKDSRSYGYTVYGLTV